MMTPNDRAQRAVALFIQGRNCAQSVLMAYADVLELTEEQAALIAVGLGGGMGRLRLTCGAFSAAVMLCGAIDGPDGGSIERRVPVYRRVQDLHDAFAAQLGSVNCGELLGRTREVPVPEQRTPEYYASRPCVKVIEAACCLIEEQRAKTFDD